MNGGGVAVWDITVKIIIQGSLLDDRVNKKRLTDDEARMEIKGMLGIIEIVRVKSLTKVKRDEVLKKMKRIEGVSQCQAARILGVSPNLIFRV